jgi:hypothetical protein
MWVLRQPQGFNPDFGHIPEERSKLGKRRSGGATKHRLEASAVWTFVEGHAGETCLKGKEAGGLSARFQPHKR